MEVPMYFPFDSTAEARLDSEKRQKYIELTLGAKEAKAHPVQSGFYVRTQVLAEDGTIYRGGNKEHALSDAYVHGETAVISGIRDITDSPIEALAWHRQVRPGEVVTPHDFGCPCGACRDVLNAVCANTLVLLNGNETGVVYAELRNYLFNSFRSLDAGGLKDGEVHKALAAADRAVDVYLPKALQPNIYGAALIAEDGSVWQGVHYTNAGYDAIPPVLNAVVHWLNSYPNGEVSERYLRLNKLVIASRGKMPDPLYRDRQAILELDEVLRHFKGNTTPLPVELVYVDGKDVSARVTDVAEWLPHPFTPGAFGMDDVIKKELVKLVGENEAKRVW